MNKLKRALKWLNEARKDEKKGLIMGLVLMGAFVLSVIILKPERPTKIPTDEYDRDLPTLLEGVYNSSYNENGYVLTRIVEMDKYGNRQEQMRGRIYKFERSVVTEIKKYRRFTNFLDSALYIWITILMEECDDNKDICLIQLG
jgi:hypothetical protein